MFVNEVSRLAADALAHVEIIPATSDLMQNRPDIWRVSIDFTGHSYVMKSGIVHYFLELKRLMRDYCAEKHLIVSENFIDEQIIQLLVDSKASNMSLPDVALHVKSWIVDIDKTKQDDYEVILPVNRYHSMGEVATPHIKIVRMTETAIDDNLCHIPRALEGRFTSKYLVDTNDTDTFAIINTRANDEKSAVELAHIIVDKFVYAIKLIDPNATASSRRKSYVGLPLSYGIYNKSKDRIRTAFTRLNEPPYTVQSNAFYNKFNKPWIRLIDFLFDGHLTELQKSIIDALYWYGEVDVHRDSLVSQYLYFLIGLEKLLVPNHERQKAKKFAEHAAIIFSGSAEHASFYEDYYKKRNMLIHEGPVIIYKEDADTLRLWLRSILLELVENATKFIDLKSYYKDVHGIEW